MLKYPPAVTPPHMLRGCLRECSNRGGGVRASLIPRYSDEAQGGLFGFNSSIWASRPIHPAEGGKIPSGLPQGRDARVPPGGNSCADASGMLKKQIAAKPRSEHWSKF